MKGLHRFLPTFASDYAGACSALYELGGLVVVHGASGCAGNVVAYDEPRAWEAPGRLYTSDLTDVDALLGRDGSVLDMAEKTYRSVGGDFVALVGTPATMIIGTDYSALAAELGERCGVPAVWIATTGTRTYEVGASEAFQALAQTLVASQEQPGVSCREAGGRTVNLLGATALDFGRGRSVERARLLLEGAGWDVSSCWAMGSSLSQLRAGLAADLNVVLSVSGLHLARWMRGRLGIPYVWARLSGEAAVGDFLTEMEGIVVGRPTDAGRTEAVPTGRRALVVGDHVVSRSLKSALEWDLGFASVEIASFFTVDRLDGHAGSAISLDEAAMYEKICKGGYDLVVGDGMLAACLDMPAGTRFVNIAHPAVSSRLLGDEGVCPYGSEILEVLERIN